MISALLRMEHMVVKGQVTAQRETCRESRMTTKRIKTLVGLAEQL